jgi:hypothetical protein
MSFGSGHSNGRDSRFMFVIWCLPIISLDTASPRQTWQHRSPRKSTRQSFTNSSSKVLISIQVSHQKVIFNGSDKSGFATSEAAARDPHNSKRKWIPAEIRLRRVLDDIDPSPAPGKLKINVIIK